ncbi:polysaccharide pyruvyl transferase family protein, partial [Plastorhodobacter daqingensis]
MRILFTPAYSGSAMCQSRYLNRSSMPLDTFNTLAGLELDNDWVTPNNGNIIHAESAAKIFECDRSLSTIGRLPGIRPEDSEETIARKLMPVEKNFDGVVLNFANIIHAKEKLAEGLFEILEVGFASTAALVEKLNDVKIFAFGVGLQDEMPAVPESIGPSLFRLLTALNDKAAIFGTRGFRTERFLHDLGLTNAVALGCPSLYVNPFSTSQLEFRPLSKDYRMTAAGRLSISGLKTGRIQPLLDVTREFDTDYAFQNDLFNLFRKDDLGEIGYNSESHEVSKSACDSYVKKKLKTDDHFSRYYYFRSPQAWRAYATTRDAYIGDRFHGGVAFLQVGRPAGFIYDDVRVLELTGYYGLKAFTPQEVKDLGKRDFGPLLRGLDVGLTSPLSSRPEGLDCNKV